MALNRNRPSRRHRQVELGRRGVLNADGHAIGIDIGARSVRAAVMAPGTLAGRPSVTIHGVGEVALPPGSVTSGLVTDPAAVTTALAQLWEQNKFECRRVILGFSNQQVVVRDLRLPNLPAEQIAKALPFQARELVPIPLDQALLDFAPLGPADPATDTVAGLLIAAPRAPIVTAVHAVEAAGLKVVRVDLSSFALLRALGSEELSVEAIIDIGAHLTNIVIHDHGVPKVVRTVNRGGSEWTELLVAKAGVDEAAAEAAKREVGIAGADPRITPIISQAIRPLLAEIRSSIQYFVSANAGVTVQRVALTGGSSALPGLVATLGDQLGVPTELVSSMQHIRNRFSTKATENDDRMVSAVSVGLAMGAAA